MWEAWKSWSSKLVETASKAIAAGAKLVLNPPGPTPTVSERLAAMTRAELLEVLQPLRLDPVLLTHRTDAELREMILGMKLREGLANGEDPLDIAAECGVTRGRVAHSQALAQLGMGARLAEERRRASDGWEW